MKTSMLHKIIVLFVVLLIASVFTGLKFELSFAMADHQTQMNQDCTNSYDCEQRETDCVVHCISQVVDQDLVEPAVIAGGVELSASTVAESVFEIPVLQAPLQLESVLPRPDPDIILTIQKRE